MLRIKEDLCKKCRICMKNCPIEAIVAGEENGQKYVRITDKCVECNICRRVCPFGVIENDEQTEGIVQCSSCSVQCKIPVGSTGACKRYTNEGGKLVRNRALVVEPLPQVEVDEKIRKPIITAVGAGTNYPCIRPAPHIVCEKRDGVDVVTTVTEAPLSYSGVLVKLDTNTYIGEEGATVYCEGKPVGMVQTEEYGSKMVYVGGANRLTAKDGGFATARTICALANGEEVELTVKTEDKKAIKIRCQQGKAPVINGVEEQTMRIGCGSATIGLLADIMKESVDECIVIDHHVTGLFSEHLAGREVGMKWSGVIPNATKSTVGRYFGGHGDGIGGTVLQTPRDAIKSVDMSVAHAGMTILVTNTTGEIAALFEVQEDGDVKEIPMTEKAAKVAKTIQENCQRSTTSVLYCGGTGGSARGGVCKHPVAITEAVHDGRARLTIGGAPAFVYPGGGINFMVDTAKVINKAFTWVPTPATVAPVEYTMTKADYEKIGGHMDQIKNVEDFPEYRK
ncbi:4Fe-4S binding protein [uncultured Dysosmobacter sp.]|uniref:4Fe-4S binding protein n=1 Tax=uncultured Dysosmobacter sp. TaxID=2591384 RepID=UPI002636D860|nr:4Fe-4S binding protein [uncultured Dysosmobacter sp.]